MSATDARAPAPVAAERRVVAVAAPAAGAPKVDEIALALRLLGQGLAARKREVA